MKQSEFIAGLKKLGWKERRAKGGGRIWYELPDRIVHMAPRIRQHPDAKMLDFMEAITTQDFEKDASFILQPTEHIFYSLVRLLPPVEIMKVDFTESDILEAHERVLAWARSVDLDAALRSHLKWKNNDLPLMVIYRFVALARTGRGDVLRDMLDKMKAGDRQGFAPFVDEQMLERAIALARSSI